ncbi:bifunctional autolysin Atl [Bacillus sp. JCM 19045]|nr:bifunctional autolysin Atl [Bacillus sp. JCM 19045]
MQTLADEFEQGEENVLEGTDEEATEEPTEEGSEEATEEPTEEGSEEATEEPTEEGSEEATEESTEEDSEENNSSFMFSMQSIQETAISKLGHINGNGKVYRNLGDTSSISTARLLNAVYYIKTEARYQNETYYQLSTHHTGTSGIVGWAKASDLSVRSHVLENRNQQTLQVKGSGNAYSKAWGGSQDLVYALSAHKGKAFNVNLTEKVGNDVWYRGTINGQQVWIHSVHVEPLRITFKNVSKLGHINRNANIYRELSDQQSIDTSSLLNAVYYIKQEASMLGTTYYQLSTHHTGQSGIIGWAKASDLSVQNHVLENRNARNLQVKGSGYGFSKAWGGSKDRIQNLSNLKSKIFHINLTEKVGNNTWYRGTIDGKQMWIHSIHVEPLQVVERNTSRLGHLNWNAKIYRNLGDHQTISTSNLLNAVIILNARRRSKDKRITY